MHLEEEIDSVYVTPDSVYNINYIIKVFTKSSRRKVENFDDLPNKNGTATMDL